jgi:hypothetical protein
MDGKYSNYLLFPRSFQTPADEPLPNVFALRQVPAGAELVLAQHLSPLIDPAVGELTLKFSLSDGLDTVEDKVGEWGVGKALHILNTLLCWAFSLVFVSEEIC